ncbi:hypothetical protein Scep_027372 [Stephania cephalantha]|uniref:Uncharacterized protein n=1 Tax=Stephania cephalantha TaxID=152367 RepID=A0AAP0HMH5_9MAGN
MAAVGSGERQSTDARWAAWLGDDRTTAMVVSVQRANVGERDLWSGLRGNGGRSSSAQPRRTANLVAAAATAAGEVATWDLGGRVGCRVRKSRRERDVLDGDIRILRPVSRTRVSIGVVAARHPGHDLESRYSNEMCFIRAPLISLIRDILGLVNLVFDRECEHEQ